MVKLVTVCCSYSTFAPMRISFFHLSSLSFYMELVVTDEKIKKKFLDKVKEDLSTKRITFCLRS